MEMPSPPPPPLGTAFLWGCAGAGDHELSSNSPRPTLSQRGGGGALPGLTGTPAPPPSEVMLRPPKHTGTGAPSRRPHRKGHSVPLPVRSGGSVAPGAHSRPVPVLLHSPSPKDQRNEGEASVVSANAGVGDCTAPRTVSPRTRARQSPTHLLFPRPSPVSPELWQGPRTARLPKARACRPPPVHRHAPPLQRPGSQVPRGALEGKGPQRRPQRRLGRRLEEVAEAVGGGYCRLQMPLRPALGVRGKVAGRRLGVLEGRGEASNASLPAPPHASAAPQQQPQHTPVRHHQPVVAAVVQRGH